MKNNFVRAAFLDRDGVINKLCYDDEKGIYSPKNVSELEIFDYVGESCRKIKDAGFQKIIVVSNQPGVAFGYIDKGDVEEMSDEIQRQIPEIDGIYNCYHHPHHTGDCECRKPKDGLLQMAAKDHEIDISASIMIGDNLSDIQAGENCAATMLIAATRLDIFQIMQSKGVFPDYIVKNLKHASLVLQEIVADTNLKNNESKHIADCGGCWRISDQDAPYMRRNS